MFWEKTILWLCFWNVEEFPHFHKIVKFINVPLRWLHFQKFNNGDDRLLMVTYLIYNKTLFQGTFWWYMHSDQDVYSQNYHLSFSMLRNLP